MKNLVILIIIGLTLTSCAKKYKGNLDVKGYLMYECGNTDPLGGTTLTFSIDGGDLLTTTTDAYGYFHFKGAYSHKSWGIGEKLIGQSFNGQNGGGFGSIDLIGFFSDKLDADTIYQNNFTNSVIHLEVQQGSIGTDLDTLYIEYYFNDKESDKYPFKQKDGFGYHIKYPGPFVNGQIIDTAITKSFPHIGYEANRSSRSIACRYFINSRIEFEKSVRDPFGKYPFVRGQRNIACGQYTNVYIKLD